jgi:hypothetical protein
MVDEAKKTEEKEVIDERRSFVIESDDIKTFYIAPPTADDIRGADWQYSKFYTKCLMEDIPTSAEMLDILTRRGIIGPEFEQRANELSLKLANAVAALDNSEDIDDKRRLSIAVARAREELFQWNQRLNGPMNNTAEQISDDSRLEYLTSCMVVDKDGNRIWDNYSDYLTEKNQALALKARFEVMLYLQGLDSDFLEQTPEAMAMREVEADIIAKTQEALKAAEAVAAEEAEAEAAEQEEEKEEEAKPVRKTTRRKKPSTK